MGGRQSERPEFMAPAFQFLLVARGDFYQTPGEDRSDFNRNGCHQATVETPLGLIQKGWERHSQPFFTVIIAEAESAVGAFPLKTDSIKWPIP